MRQAATQKSANEGSNIITPALLVLWTIEIASTKQNTVGKFTSLGYNLTR